MNYEQLINWTLRVVENRSCTVYTIDLLSIVNFFPGRQIYNRVPADNHLPRRIGHASNELYSVYLTAESPFNWFVLAILVDGISRAF